MSEQLQKLQKVEPGQDYIADWANAWSVDHYFEANQSDWNFSATAVYFDFDKKEVIFTELYAEIQDVLFQPNWSKDEIKDIKSNYFSNKLLPMRWDDQLFYH